VSPRVVLGAVPAGGDRDALDMLDPALDVVALWSLRDHREEPPKSHIPAGAVLDVDQAAIADGAATTRGRGATGSPYFSSIAMLNTVNSANESRR
jgi:hypothetical protein